jgi:hypothetical protein
MPLPRGIDRRIRVLEVRIPRPPPPPDSMGEILQYLTAAELTFIERGRCDDSDLVELLNRARERRDAGADMVEVERLEQACADWWPRGDGLKRRVILHPCHDGCWLDTHDGTEGEIT